MQGAARGGFEPGPASCSSLASPKTSRKPPSPQVDQLWAYQKDTGARANRWNVWPATIGFEPDPGSCSSGPATARLTGLAPLEGTTVDRAKALDVSGLYR